MLREQVAYRQYCRAGGGPLHDVLHLGDLHLSGFLAPGDPVPEQAPLTLAVAPRSGLAQLRHSVDPALLFRRYWYRSATNEAMRDHLHGIVDAARSRLSLPSQAVVLDIGCNDGTLLSFYDESILRVGFDPAQLIPQHVDVFVNDFFSREAYGDLPKAHIVTSIAMFYDLDDPVAFAQEVAQVLTDDGLWILEMHYLPTLLSMNGFDALCHEHLCYYSLRSLEYVLEQADLVVEHVSFNAVNGGSFRAYIRKLGRAAPTSRVSHVRTAESRQLDFERFFDHVQANRDQTVDLLADLRAQGQRVLGYGASTKGNTLLQYYGITPDVLPAIADRNPDKWGLVTAGTGIPIISEEEARQQRPDYFFVLPYHFLSTFLEREQTFLGQGGRFIVPMPMLRVLP